MYKTQLKTTPLGTTGLEITRVGFGAWALGAITGFRRAARWIRSSPRRASS